MKLLYKVGDKVMVRKDIQEDDRCHMVSCTESPGYRGMYVNSEMAAKAGKIVTIEYIIEDMGYGKERYTRRRSLSYGELDGWSWTDEMFERKRNSILFNQLL